MKRILLVILFTLFTSAAIAAGTVGNEKQTTASTGVEPATKFDIGKKWVSKAKKFESKKKDAKAKNAYKKAIKKLLESNAEYPSDPDTLNLLGFAHRKIGDYDNAEIYYSMGLEIDPKHIGINEYMGELFVVTNRLDKAKERLEVLKSCNCKEYDELKQVISGTKKSKY